jgi:hypothetical protein
MNFKELLTEVRFNGRKVGSPPLSMAEIAARCCVSRPHLYNLMAGTMVASEWTIEKIAAGLKRSLALVTASLRRSRAK